MNQIQNIKILHARVEEICITTSHLLPPIFCYNKLTHPFWHTIFLNTLYGLRRGHLTLALSNNCRSASPSQTPHPDGLRSTVPLALISWKGISGRSVITSLSHVGLLLMRHCLSRCSWNASCCVWFGVLSVRLCCLCQANLLLTAANNVRSKSDLVN